ncbi:alpha/beta hydrolase [Paenibacillus hunanensis]|uniref:alpha/beta fold hydrolase n=1 Tax=Paenibacillus hunanensis TaxID=539262 RepID=UPI002026F8DC|nr:alpha/beta hydrolase [Paenibacillus hunanensis]MCL9662439.1 alpha/beta hydrolase [Paenibacillus hunanensis]
MSNLPSNSIQQPPLHYTESGKGTPLVLLHGFLGSSAYWDELIPLLSSSYRCITPDLRGHGRSLAPEGSYRIEQMADDVIQLLDYLQLPSATVLGHSMGGYVTLALAEQHADRLDGWGLIHSTPHEDAPQAKENRLLAVSKINSEGIAAFTDGMVEGLFAPASLEQLPKAVQKVRELGYATPPQGACGAALAMRERPDRRQILATSPKPILLVAGAQDRLIPSDRLFTSEGDNIKTHIIASAGHMGMLETPAELAEIIRDYLG